MTRALVTQLMSALDYHQFHTRPMQYSKDAIKAAREYLATEPKPTLTEALAQQGIKLRTEFEPKQRNVELATEPSGERAELIEKLRAKHDERFVVSPSIYSKAADMLEADAQPKQVTCQIYGHVVGACVECNTHIEAQQAKRVPMDEPEDLYALALKADNWGQP